ncbi:MAG: PAS domain S-box protein [Pyrinomonadaceae bacterium]
MILPEDQSDPINTDVSEPSPRFSRKQYESLLRTIDGIIWEAEADPFRLVFVNKKAETLLGYSVEQWLTEPDFWANHLHPADREWATEFCAKAEERREDHELEYRMIAADDRVVWFKDRVTLNIDDDQTARYRGLMMDITNRMKAEEALRENREELTEAQRIAKVGSWTWDIATNEVTWSDELYRPRGLDPNSPAPTLEEQQPFYTPESWTRLSAAINEAVTNGTPYELELEIVLEDSRHIWFMGRGEAVRDETGKIVKLRGTAQDITDRRIAEKSLRESQRRFRETLTNLEMIAVMTGSDGKITFCNDYMLRLTGWVREEVLGRLWSEVFLHDIDHDKAGILNSFPPDGPITAHFENQIKTRDGELRSVNWTNTALWDVQGRVIGVASLGDDVTERKRAEEALRLSESRYKKIVESAPEGIVVMDLATGKFVDFNQQALKLFDVTADEILGLGPADMCPEFQPDGQRSAEAIIGNVHRSLSGETPVFEWVHCNSKGDPFPCEVRLLQLPDESRMLIRGTIVDITEQKRIEQAVRLSEERYRDLVENTIDIIYSHDLDGNFTSINRAGEQLSGYTRDEACELNLTDITAPEFHQTVKEAMVKTLSGHGDEVLDVDIIAKDGRRIAIEVKSSVIYQNGEAVGIQGTARDVTDRKHLEQQLLQSQKLESVGRLAGGIAHDFNNMLTAINGYSSLVLEELPSGDPLRHYVEEIKSAGERSASLTQQLLAFSRKQIMQPLIIDVNTVVTGIEQMLRRLIGENINLKTELAPGLSSVMADPTQIEQVIVNLVVNARDAMPNGGTLKIETRNLQIGMGDVANHLFAQEGSYAVISVTDSGIGIPEDIRQHIFEPFFTTREIGRGTGLGLATVYGIVKQSNGYIELDTELGSGTTFSVYLPIVEKHAENDARRPNSEPSLRGYETVLLIEDEEAVRSVVSALLKRYGYTVFAAADGAEAVAICDNHSGPIHLLISDVVMPKISGPALAQKLLAKRKDMTVLYVSGYPGEAIAHHGILASDINFLQKPFTHEALAQKVNLVLGKMRKAQGGN